jgi:hypothetical protein
MIVQSVAFTRLQDRPPAFERWQMRVLLRGEFELRAIPLVVAVGDVNVELLVPSLGEEGITGIQGLLAEIPQVGDEVRVGYADGPLLSTGFEFSETPDA